MAKKDFAPVISALAAMVKQGASDTDLQAQLVDTLGDEATQELMETLIQKAKSAESEDKYPDDIKKCFESYPDENEIYRTSDGQLFLSSNKQWAKHHQSSLDNNKDVERFIR